MGDRHPLTPLEINSTSVRNFCHDYLIPKYFIKFKLDGRFFPKNSVYRFVEDPDTNKFWRNRVAVKASVLILWGYEAVLHGIILGRIEYPHLSKPKHKITNIFQKQNKKTNMFLYMFLFNPSLYRHLPIKVRGPI